MITSRSSSLLRKMVAFFFLAILVVGCSPAQKNLSPDFGTSSHRAFAAQTLNSVGPENRSHVDTTPGDLSNQIYQKRYIKMLTEDKKDKESGSDQLKGLQ